MPCLVSNGLAPRCCLGLVRTTIVILCPCGYIQRAEWVINLFTHVAAQFLCRDCTVLYICGCGSAKVYPTTPLDYAATLPGAGLVTEGAVNIKRVLELAYAPYLPCGTCHRVVVDDNHYKGLEEGASVCVHSTVGSIAGETVELSHLPNFNVLLQLAPWFPACTAGQLVLDGGTAGAYIYIAVAAGAVAEGEHLGNAFVV